MKAASQGRPVERAKRAYTLIELLCSLGIVLLLAAMMLPAMRNGYAKVHRLYCVNNLHQTGLAFHSFAHSHQDRFPMQLPASEGGSLEYLRAAEAMTGEFYFSYRHFQPLSNELAVTKVLTCPTDTRLPATNFATMLNENLSYFVAGTPQFGDPGSVLAGNRNVAPAYGSIARVGGYRRLMWTEELHRFKGNVLFGDGHVEQLNDMFGITNGAMANAASLHMPSVHPPPESASSGGPYYQPPGGVGPRTRGSPRTVWTVTNQVGSNLVVSWVTGGGRRGGALLLFPPSGDGGGGGASPTFTDEKPAPTLAARVTAPPRLENTKPAGSGLKEIYEQATTQVRQLGRDAATLVYNIPWYLLLLLVAALLELRRRIRARHRRLAASP